MIPMTTPNVPDSTEAVVTPVDDVETEVTTEEGTVFTAADRDALKKALAAERKQHREAANKLTALEAEKLTGTDKEWADKLANAEASAAGRIKKLAARTELSAAGLQGKADRLVSLLDLSEVDVDAEGVVTGLDEQIKSLKAEFPGLFGEAKTAAPNVGQLNLGNPKAGPKKEQTFAEKLGNQLFTS